MPDSHEFNRWRGETQSKLEAHAEYHEKHFNAIDDLKISLTEIRTRVAIFSLFGAGIGSLLAYLLISLVNHTLPVVTK